MTKTLIMTRVKLWLCKDETLKTDEVLIPKPRSHRKLKQALDEIYSDYEVMKYEMITEEKRKYQMDDNEFINNAIDITKGSEEE